MARKKVKKIDMLKLLSDDMKSMMGDSKTSSLKDLLGNKEGTVKATVISDSTEGLKKGLSKAEQILKAKLGNKSEDSECSECGESPCKCE